MLPIICKLTIADTEFEHRLRVENEATLNANLDTQFVPFPISNLEEKMAYWDSKYGDTNPPPYPVTSVDTRLGDVELADLYDTDALSLSEIAELFND